MGRVKDHHANKAVKPPKTVQTRSNIIFLVPRYIIFIARLKKVYIRDKGEQNKYDNRAAMTRIRVEYKGDTILSKYVRNSLARTISLHLTMIMGR